MATAAKCPHLWRPPLHDQGDGRRRSSEIIGLRRRSVDVDASAVTVVEQLARIDGEWVRGKPKSHAGRRRIALPRFVAEVLRDHLDTYVAGRRRARVRQTAGNPLHQSIFQTHHWKPAKARAGLELRFHDLRHTAVALAIQAGAHPKTIQVRMGHSSVTVTLDRCGHLFPELDTDVAERLDETSKRHLLAIDGPGSRHGSDTRDTQTTQHRGFRRCESDSAGQPEYRL